MLFAFILLYFFDLLSLQRQHPLPWSEANWLYQEFPGTFAPKSESSRELSFLGAKVPTGNFRSEERKYRGAKSPDTGLGYLTPCTRYSVHCTLKLRASVHGAPSCFLNNFRPLIIKIQNYSPDGPMNNNCENIITCICLTHDCKLYVLYQPEFLSTQPLSSQHPVRRRKTTVQTWQLDLPFVQNSCSISC